MFDQSTLAQVDDKAQQYMNNPQALQQMYQQKQQLIDLLALQKIKSEKGSIGTPLARFLNHKGNGEVSTERTFVNLVITNLSCAENEAAA